MSDAAAIWQSCPIGSCQRHQECMYRPCRRPTAQAIPLRIQRRRAAGWKAPENAVYVGRPGIFGNPFPVEIFGRELATLLHRRWLTTGTVLQEDADEARLDLDGMRDLRAMVLERLPALRGKSLLCWCAPFQACHADVLLEIANGPGGQQRGGVDA